MAELNVDAELDISDALSQIHTLGEDYESTFDASGRNAAEAITETLGGIQIDAIAIDADLGRAEDAIAQLGEAAPIDIPVDADTQAAQATLDALTEQPPIDIPVDADTSLGEASLADFAALADAFDARVGVDADAAAAEQRLEEFAALAEATDAVVTVDADTGDAEAQLEGIAEAAESAGGQLGGLTAATSGLNAASGLAAGSAGALGGAVQDLGSGAGAAVGAAAALTAGVGFLVGKANEAVGLTQRFNSTLGEFRGELENVNVGSLNADLGELAISLGTDDEALKDSSASMFQFATNAGIAGHDAARFAEEVASLAARAVALNPQLGSVAQVMPLMARGLATGGRFAQRFGLDLNAADIASRALADTGKTLTKELTVTEKQMAGAAIAVEKYGATLGEDVQAGTENAIIRQRRLGVELENIAEKLGQPLVFPLIDLLNEAMPIAEAAGTVLARLGEVALPILSAAVELVVPPLKLLATVLNEIPDPILTIAAAALIAKPALSGLGALMSGLFDSSTAAAGGLRLLSNPLVAIPALMIGAGLGLGFLFGAFDDATSHAEKFKTALEGQRSTLLGNSSTLQGAVADVHNLDQSFEKYIKTASAFDSEDQIDDLKRWGVSVDELRGFMERGEAGIRAFIRQGLDTGHVKAEFRGVALSAKEIQQFLETGRTTVKGYSLDVRDGARALQGLSINGDKVTDTLIAETEAFQRVNRETLNNLQATGQVTPQIVQLAREMSRGEDGAINWSQALDLATSSTVKLVPRLSELQRELLDQANAFSSFSTAALAASTSLPTIGSLLGTAAQNVKDFTGSLDPTLITQNLDSLVGDFANFYNNITTLTTIGATNVATALLQLGPELGGPLSESLLSAGSDAINGLESGLARGSEVMFQLAVDLEVASEKAKVIAGAIGSGIGGKLLEAFSATNFGQLTAVPLVAIQAAADAVAADPSLEAGFAGKARLVEGAFDIDLKPKVIGATTDAAAAVTDGAPAVTDAAAQLGADVHDAAVVPVQQIPADVAGAANAASAAALGAVPGAEAAGAAVGGGLKTGHNKGLEGMDTDAAAKAGKAGTDAAAEGTRHTGAMAEAGRALSHGLATGIGDGTDGVKAAARSLATDGAAGARNTGAWSDAGAASGSAYGHAIDSGANVSVAEAAGRHLARAAAEAAKHAGSPTEHLWFDSALDMGTAYAKGFIASEAVVARATTGLALAAVGAGPADAKARMVAGVAGAGAGARTSTHSTHIDVRPGAVQLKLTPPSGATPAEVGEMAREATTESLAALQSELAALGS